MLGEGIEQLYVFVVFVVLGVVLAAVYVFCLGLFRSRLAGAICDCMWGAASLWLVWRTNLAVNNGECRLFVFIALAIGALIAYVTCKRMLDKASALLYNLFTTKLVDKADGSNLLQENNVNTVRDGDIGATDTRLPVAGVTDATGSAKRTRKRIARNDSKGRRQRHHPARAARVHAIQRIRGKMGRSERKNIS